MIYGDKNNWWAAYALWVFTLFGHEDVRLLDGGRAKWIAEDRPVTTDRSDVTAVDYPVVEREDAPVARSRTTSSTTSASRSSTCAAPPSTAATAPRHRTTRRRARCAAATSPPR